jgi:hypothetical protein
MNRRSGSRRKRLNAESLEPRLMLSSDGGILGADARLTLSFAPDGTDVAGEVSDLFDQMDAMAPRAEWQAAILNGFQSWASLTNGDVGQVADDGPRFGVPGRIRQDPRFGDIRIGSIPLDNDLFAVSVSADEVIDGTWTADVLFNSDKINSGKGIQNLDQVFAVAVHEAGHVFGLEHSEDPLSPMFVHGIPGHTLPTADDITNLQQIYGQRAHDIYDLELDGAAPPIQLEHFRLLDGAKGSAPTVVFADITDLSDQDDYYLEVYDGYSGSITFELIVSGISQLATRVVITDQNNFGFADATMAAGVDGAFTIQNVSDSDRFNVRIESGSQGPSGIGGYTLIATFNEDNQASASAVYDLARVPIRYLDMEELGEYFEDGELLFANEDGGANDLPGFETELETAPGFEEGSRFLQYASIEQPGDVDRYSVETTEAVVPGRDWARFNLRSVAGDSLSPEMLITDDQYVPVPVEYLVRNSESTIVQFGPFAQGERYFIEVSGASQLETGNYELDLVFGTTSIERAEFVSRQLLSQQSVDRFVLRLRRPQLFHFSFAVDSVPGDVRLRMRIIDSAGVEIKRIEAAAGDVRTTAVFLSGTQYRVLVDTVSGSFNGLNYQITGSAVDDPLGPTPIDTTVSPFDFDEEKFAILIASIFSV